MIIEYTGRHMTVTVKAKAQAEAGIARIEKIVGRGASAHVILTEEKYRKIAEVTVKTCGGNLVATCEATEMETALHNTLSKVEHQAIKHKQRVTTIRQHPKPLAMEAL
jgi:putative sigma-54 modulation protein